jgi:2-dehydro-3-deoxyphosphogluconate aldolase/(4S)-4-hydroxy-2-oxoglutarate aldolase
VKVERMKWLTPWHTWHRRSRVSSPGLTSISTAVCTTPDKGKQIVIEEILRRLKSAPVVPLVAPDDAESAIRTTKALVDGGLSVVEVVLRTPAAVQCLGEIVRAVPDAIIGAGTVLNAQEAGAVIDEGAQFIVLPGLFAPVIELAQQAGIPVFPGVATATEAQNGWNMGLRTLKFFPASLSGGVPMLKALGSVFKDVSFMPTGGVSAANLLDFLALPNVVACGGSWLTPKTAIEQGDYHVVTELAAEAVKIAKTVRG